MEQKYKVVLLGNSGIGKSSFINRLKSNTFILNIESTIGCEFCCYTPDKTFMNKPMKFLIWDTSGQEIFKSFTSQFTRNAKICLLFTDNIDVNFLMNYIAEWKLYIPDDCKILLVPAKSDLIKYNLKKLYDICVHDKNIHVSLPISSKTRMNIDELIYQITRILYNVTDVTDNKNTISLISKETNRNCQC